MNVTGPGRQMAGGSAHADVRHLVRDVNGDGCAGRDVRTFHRGEKPDGFSGASMAGPGEMDFPMDGASAWVAIADGANSEQLTACRADGAFG